MTTCCARTDDRKDLEDDDRALAHALGRGSADGFTLPGAKRHYSPDLGLCPAHLDIDIAIDVEAKTATAKVTTTLVARRAGVRRVVFDAVELADVEVTDPDGGALEWAYDGEKLEVTWSSAPDVGQKRHVEVRYRVVDPVTGMLFSWPDDAYPDRPKLAVTDHETERARYWLPCIDHPEVRTTLAFHIRTSEAFTALANGEQEGEEVHGDGTKTVHWALSETCPSYLVCIAVGELVRADLGRHEGKEVAFFAPRGTETQDLVRNFGVTTEMLDWMVGKLGVPFPYPKYFQFAAPGVGGAMENVSLVSWDGFFLFDAGAHEEKGFLLDLVNVHEMAHSYFGDLLTCRDFSEVWLKESWATYIESVWVEDRYGADELQAQLHSEENEYRDEADGSYQRPIVTRTMDSSWSMFDRHLYPGGALRLHMLRRRLGDRAFWAAVRDYLSTYAGRAVETSDFRRKLESHSGESLTRFFDQWLYAPGYPKLKVSYAYDAELGEVTLTIEQTQVDQKRGVGLFDVPLTVAVETRSGGFVRYRRDIKERKEQMVLSLSERPLQVVIDPDFDVTFRLDFDPGQTMLERSLRNAPTLRGRIWAARSLAKSGKKQAMAALATALRKEESWAVRAEIARSLGGADHPAALPALIDAWGHEKSPRVRPVIAEAIGSYRDERAASALVAALRGTGIGEFARAALVEALGRQRGDQHVDMLVEALSHRGHWGLVRRAATSALGSTRSARAVERLLERCAYGVDEPQVRAATVRALGAAGRWQERPLRERVIERVSDLARDRDLAVRLAVPAALASLRADRAGVVERLVARVPAQDVPKLRRAQASMRREAGEGTDVAKLSERIDELVEERRRIVDRLDKLEGKKAPAKGHTDRSKRPKKKPAAVKAKAKGKTRAGKKPSR